MVMQLLGEMSKGNLRLSLGSRDWCLVPASLALLGEGNAKQMGIRISSETSHYYNVHLVLLCVLALISFVRN